jgi:hypothetical protein
MFNSGTVRRIHIHLTALMDMRSPDIANLLDRGTAGEEGSKKKSRYVHFFPCVYFRRISALATWSRRLQSWLEAVKRFPQITPWVTLIYVHTYTTWYAQRLHILSANDTDTVGELMLHLLFPSVHRESSLDNLTISTSWKN